jgi:hypothetical protein
MRSSPQIEGGTPSALVKALNLSPRDWLDLAVAGVELAIARVYVAVADRSALLRPPVAESPSRAKVDPRVERVRLAVARASHRLPWRADCLVQAIAARRWLGRLGVETDLRIGVPGQARDPFEAHAWLMHGDEVITGGDIGDYVPLLDSVSQTDSRRSRKS